MEQNSEYHDPDYPKELVIMKEEPVEFADDDKIDKIKSIIRREFSNELEIRENEVMLIEQRMSTSRRLLHSLRYALVSSYFNDQKLQLTNSQIEDDVAHTHLDPRARNQTTSLLRDGQRRLHPSVRKLVGKKTVDLNEIFLSRSLRHQTRKDYSAMVQRKNYTIAADTTKSLRPDSRPELEAEESKPPVPEPEPSSSKPKKVPRRLDPKVDKVVTIDDPTRNKMKHRYRFIIGNTSKYAPGASQADRSTHKWLLYVRGAPPRPDPTPLLTALHVRLHHSYAPHHTVRLCKAPFHISRRGWGEFPARLELHFPLPEVNRPASLDHTIKLDRNYTGLQTLGAETIVDVWLYSTPEMLEYEYFEPVPTPISQSKEPPEEPKVEEGDIKPKIEPIEYEPSGQTDNWLDFFSKDTTELDVDEMIIKPIKKEIIEEKNDIESLIDTNVINKDENKPSINEVEWSMNDFSNIELPNDVSLPITPRKRIMKYIDSATGKIYYLEMDRNLDLSKVQEIVINNKKTAKISPIKTNGLKSFRKNKGVSLLKPEVKSQLKSDISVKENSVVNNFSHLDNDHCYLGNKWCFQSNNNMVKSRLDHSAISGARKKSILNNLCLSLSTFSCVRDAVYYLLKKISIITDMAVDEDYVSDFPFVVVNEEKYWKLDFAKRRNIEWSRAKLINRMLLAHFNQSEQIWRTKQILIFSRMYGFNPVRPDPVQKLPETDDWSSWHHFEHSRRSESDIKEVYPNASDICSLSVFDADDYLNTSCASIENLDSDEEEVDVLCSDSSPKVKKVVTLETNDSGLTVLPVENEEDRLRFMYVERKCADIGVELRNEDIGNGYSYSAVHAVLLSAVRSLAEELIRSARAQLHPHPHPHHALPPVWEGGSCARRVVGGHVHAACGAAPRLRALSAHATATAARPTTPHHI